MPKLTKDGNTREILQKVMAGFPADYSIVLNRSSMLVYPPGGGSFPVRIAVRYPKSLRRWKESDPVEVWVGNKARFQRRRDGAFNLLAIVARARAKLQALAQQEATLRERALASDIGSAAEEIMVEHLRQFAPATLPLSMQCSATLGVTITIGPMIGIRAEQVLRWLGRMPDVEFLRGQVWRHKAQGFESEITEVKGDGYVVLHSGHGPDLLLLQRELVERWDLVSPSDSDGHSEDGRKA